MHVSASRRLLLPYPEPHLHGDLSLFPLNQLLQSLTLSHSTLTVGFPLRAKGPEDSPQTASIRDHLPHTLERLGLSAYVTLSRGSFVGARFGQHEGLAALARLALCRAGYFEVEPERVPEHPQTEPLPVDAVLLRVSVSLDEATQRLTPIPALDTPLALARTASEFEAHFVDDQPTTARRILIASPGEFGEVVLALAAAARRRDFEVRLLSYPGSHTAAH